MTGLHSSYKFTAVMKIELPPWIPCIFLITPLLSCSGRQASSAHSDKGNDAATNTRRFVAPRGCVPTRTLGEELGIPAPDERTLAIAKQRRAQAREFDIVRSEEGFREIFLPCSSASKIDWKHERLVVLYYKVRDGDRVSIQSIEHQGDKMQVNLSVEHPCRGAQFPSRTAWRALRLAHGPQSVITSWEDRSAPCGFGIPRGNIPANPIKPPPDETKPIQDTNTRPAQTSCTPGSSWKQDCNTCICPRSGLTREARCTRQYCEPPRAN